MGHRPANKQQRIVDFLLDQIVQGRYGPGSQLPTRAELEATLGASTVTIQRAMDQLAGDGFIESRGRLGTFVADCPPHLCHYGIVFPSRPGELDHWLRFWTALEHEAGRRSHRCPKRRVSVFYAGDGRRDHPDFRRLNAVVRGRRIAGLIFPFTPRSLEGAPAITQPGIVRIGLSPASLSMGMARMKLSHASFFSRALDELLAAGRERIAVVSVPRNFAEAEQDLADALRQRGLSIPNHWMQAIDDAFPQWAGNWARLLMHAPPDQRPNGLIIANDNLVEHVSAGLVDIGVSVPDDLAVIAHCNFPWPAPSVLPVRRLGYNAAEVMDRCIKLIDQLRTANDIPPEPVVIDARFEEECLLDPDQATDQPDPHAQAQHPTSHSPSPVPSPSPAFIRTPAPAASSTLDAD